MRNGSRAEVGGTITIYATGAVSIEDSFLAADRIDDTLGGEFDFASGVLQFNRFDGDLVNQGGTVAPGPGTSSATIVGDYTQQQIASLAFEIDGSTGGHDVLTVTELADLDGALKLSLANGVAPEAADTFSVFAANSLVGLFDNVANGQRLTTTDDRGSFLVHYGVGSAFDANQIVLSDFLTSLSSAGLTGDYNGNGVVEQADLDLVLLHWGADASAAPETWTNDLPVGIIDQGELDGVLLHWGSRAASTLAAAAGVPEPGGIVLGLLALAMVPMSSRWLVQRR